MARRDRDLPEAPPRYDAYFGMLVISLVATLTALLFLWLDYSSFSDKPKPPQKATANLNLEQ